MEKNEIKRLKKKSYIVFLIMLCIIIISPICFSRIISKSFIKKELISQSRSPDGKYSIKAYLVNGGATVDWSVQCYLNTSIIGNKLIYNDYHVKTSRIHWIDKDTVSINGHKIDLPNGLYDFKINRSRIGG